MPGPGAVSSLRDSHLAASMRRPENRLSAVVTLLVAVTVALLSWPALDPGFSIDLRDAPRWSAGRSADLLGFGRATADGRLLSRREARVVWNRPLPPRFALEIEGRARPVPLELTLRIGRQRHRVRFDAELRTHRIAVENPWRAREIVLERRWRPNVELSLVRLGVREVPPR